MIKAGGFLPPKSSRILTSGTGDKACRPDVSRSSRGRKKSTTVLSVGQEVYTLPQRGDVGSSLSISNQRV